MFNFELRPLEQVHPWGDLTLHWFGLTEGIYWIQAGATHLFEYSSVAQDALGAQRFCDYQVARLYEDVIELTPYVLEPVPEDLRKYISISESSPWNHYWNKWSKTLRSDVYEESVLLDNAGTWLGARTLDSGYLTPSTNIVLWSDEDFVHVEWDNREKRLEGGLAWTAKLGSWQIPRLEFMDEVRSFHSRLMEQMAERISLVESGELPSSIYVDMKVLLREQEIRARPIDRTLRFRTPPTDWQAVSSAIKAIESREA